jgi:aspartyl-tRNA(Asn)/glutamyl-tRNA(Gln) amidotransferase subunit A
MAEQELCFLPASDLVGLLAAGKVSSVEVTRAFLERIDRFDGALRAFITVDAEQALAEAEHARGPLHGLPVAVKDNIPTRGLRTTGGSRVLRDWVPDHDAPVVQRLRDAGGVVLGKTNLHEFAYGGTCANVEFGAVRNPWNQACVPGGSSGGSGVAVAAGLAPAALGTDTAGSIRLPACQCGVVGLKAGYGRVSIESVIPLAWSLDHVGPITRTVADAGLLLGAVSGQPTAVPFWQRGLRLGVPRAYFFEGLQPDVEAAVEQALNVLRGLGATLMDVEWPAVKLSNSATWTIILAEASAYHRPWFRERPQDYSDEIRGNLELGERVAASDYIQAQRARTILKQQIREVLTRVDALVTPMLAITAPKIGQATIEIGGKIKEINPVFIRLADPFNLTGLPAISVPCGFSTDRLPIGLQIAAATEATVLQVAQAYESATDWHTRRPPL